MSLISTGCRRFATPWCIEIVNRADQADAANHRGLGADIDSIAADIDVGVADGLQDLRQGQPVGHQLVEIDLQLIGLGLAAPSR